MISFKYRLNPNSTQFTELNSIFDRCRSLYNSALQERNDFYKKTKRSISFTQQAKSLTEIRANLPEYNELHCQMTQQVLKTLDRSFQNFFRRVKQKSSKVGFPRFKTRDSFKSICFPQIFPSKTDKYILTGGVKLLPNDKLIIPNVSGEIKIVMHRFFRGRCKQIKIIHQHGKFYVLFICEVPKITLPKTNKIIGIDLGLINFATLDNGTKYYHPKPFKTSKEKLAYRQRKLAKKKKGSNNYRKQTKLVAKQQEKNSKSKERF